MLLGGHLLELDCRVTLWLQDQTHYHRPPSQPGSLPLLPAGGEADGFAEAFRAAQEDARVERH